MHFWIGPFTPSFFWLFVFRDQFLIIYHEIFLYFCFPGESPGRDTAESEPIRIQQNLNQNLKMSSRVVCVC